MLIAGHGDVYKNRCFVEMVSCVDEADGYFELVLQRRSVERGTDLMPCDQAGENVQAAWAGTGRNKES